MAVYKRNGLLKASIASATNAHRLGANEAPPAIISVFLGRQISAVLDKLASSSCDDTIEFRRQVRFPDGGTDHIPELLIDNTDRKPDVSVRLYGNRFEFRAVGSFG